MIPNRARLPIVLLLGIIAGCQPVEVNPAPPATEADILSDYVQLTHGFARAGEAYFSPDAKWIIFQASMKLDEDYSMYLAQLQWKGDKIAGIDTPIRISPLGSWNSCGFFSTDGNSIIFSSTVQPVPKAPPPATGSTKPSYNWAMPKTAEIYRADGWKGAIAAAPPGGSVDLARHPITANEGYDAECGLSPDGQWIIYCSNVTGDPEIWAMRSDGSSKVQLTHNPGYDGGPFFAPDGKRICYRSDRKLDGNLQVFVADLKFNSEGEIIGIQNEKQLTDNNAVNFGPFWNSDNKHLIWATSLHGQANFELYLMRDDGTHKTRITFSPEAMIASKQAADVLPVFSPDGQWLMWTTKRSPDKTSQIWAARFKMPKGS